jgi:peptide deformylase
MSSPAHPEPAGEAAVATPRELDAETAERRAAALQHVRQYGDPVLRERARPVEAFDDSLRAEAARMIRLMDDALGVGLAATQLGSLHRLFVYRMPDGPARVLVNPEIEWSSDEREHFHEGCLSLPEVWVDVERPARVRIRGLDEHGEEVVIDAADVEASIVQHELDHLDGVLILDRIPKDVRKQAMRALREALDADRR